MTGRRKSSCLARKWRSLGRLIPSRDGSTLLRWLEITSNGPERGTFSIPSTSCRAKRRVQARIIVLPIGYISPRDIIHPLRKGLALGARFHQAQPALYLLNMHRWAGLMEKLTSRCLGCLADVSLEALVRVSAITPRKKSLALFGAHALRGRP